MVCDTFFWCDVFHRVVKFLLLRESMFIRVFFKFLISVTSDIYAYLLLLFCTWAIALYFETSLGGFASYLSEICWLYRAFQLFQNYDVAETTYLCANEFIPKMGYVLVGLFTGL